MLEHGFRYVKAIDSLSLILVKSSTKSGEEVEEGSVKREEEVGEEPANKRRRTSLSVSESANCITSSFNSASEAFG